jgi:WD40 repeat protein
MLAVAKADGTIRLWHTPYGVVLDTLVTGCGAVRAVTFSPDGGILASGSQDGSIKLWMINNKPSTDPLKPHVPLQVSQVRNNIIDDDEPQSNIGSV